MFKRFNIISSFVDWILLSVIVIYVFWNGLFILVLRVFSGPNGEIVGSNLIYFTMLLLSCIPISILYLSYFLFTKNKKNLRMVYRIKKNKSLRWKLYIILFPLVFIAYTYFTFLDINNVNRSVDMFSSTMYSIADSLMDKCSAISLIILTFTVFCLSEVPFLLVKSTGLSFLIVVFSFICIYILFQFVILFEPWEFITSLKQEVKEKVCRIYNSIPCTFLLWILLSTGMFLSCSLLVGAIENELLENELLKNIAAVAIALLITFPVVITDGMGKAVNFIKRHYIKILIPFFILLEFKILYFDSIRYGMFFFGIIVVLLIMLTLYTPFKRRREENRAIRAEIKSELGI